MAQAADPAGVGNIALAVAGDEVAFGRIVVAYHEDMRRVCAFVTRDDALAEDAVQAAWSVVWRKLGSLRGSERLRPWLVSVAVNQANDLMRQRQRRSRTEVAADTSRFSGGTDPATGIELLDAIAAMDRLKPEDRALIAMRYLLGFDASEISVAIGANPAAVRQRLKRLLGRLREELE